MTTTIRLEGPRQTQTRLHRLIESAQKRRVNWQVLIKHEDRLVAKMGQEGFDQYLDAATAHVSFK